jgi:beta-lactam-binding protein with PASTA domain
MRSRALSHRELARAVANADDGHDADLAGAHGRGTGSGATSGAAGRAGSLDWDGDVGGPRAQPTAPTTITEAPALPQSTVPDLSGKSEAAAVDTLDQAGLLPSIVFVPSQDPLGTVEAQSKSAGMSLPASARVQINLSQGPNMTVAETIPNVVGKTLTDAVSVLNASHLRLIYIKRPVQTRADVGTVIQQTPLSGGQAPQNAQVLVFLGVLATR